MFRGFPNVTSAIVALAMLKTRLLLIPRAPFPQVVQLIPKLKGPVPSPLKVPVFACNGLPVFACLEGCLAGRSSSFRFEMRAQNMNTAAAVAAVTHDVSSQGECVDRILTIVHQLQNEIKERDARQERAVSQAKEITRKEVSQALLNRFELEISQLHVNFDQRFREVVAQTEGLEQLKERIKPELSYDILSTHGVVHTH